MSERVFVDSNILSAPTTSMWDDAVSILRFMPNTSGAPLFLTLVFAQCVSGQLAFDSPEEGKAQLVGVSCETFSRIAIEFLNKRGMKVSEDWSCGGAGFRCIITKNAPPRGADGKALSRGDVLRNYLKDPAKAGFRPKSQGHGYWEVPDRNFAMGSSLQLRNEGTDCNAKLTLGFSMRYTQFLVILPYELYGNTLSGNGLLEAEYLAAIEKELPH